MLFGQTVIPVIPNSYAEVSNIDYCSNSLTIITTAVADFQIGKKVLLIQMNGANLDNAQSDENGKVINPASAGNYEYNEIALFTSVGVNTYNVTFKYNIERFYDVAHYVQLVSVPVYTDAILNNNITCEAWNGSTGGVLVFDVENTLIFNANIITSGKGFRGGTLSADDNNCPNAQLFTCANSGLCGALKGEGTGSLYGFKARGRNGNGGGGGNDHNAGGGGGGNFSFGGNAGTLPYITVNPCPGIGGLGGDSMVYNNVLNKLYMGGAGGAGDQNNNLGTAGANGGALVIINANTINGNSFLIISDGDNAASTTDADGAGGGGAGGTVVLNANSLNGNLGIVLDGGDGGSVSSTTNRCYGTGAGGSGGAAWISANSAWLGLTVQANGGQAGVETASGSPCFGTTSGSENGKNGGLITGFAAFEDSVLYTPLTVNITASSDTICQGDAVTLNANPNGSQNYFLLWNPTGSSNAEITHTPSSTLEYSVSTGIVVGSEVIACNITDRKQINVFRIGLNLSALPATDVFRGDSVLLMADTFSTGGITQLNWEAQSSENNVLNPNLKNTNVFARETGNYCLTATDVLGCKSTECITVEVVLPRVDVPEAFTPNGDGLNDTLNFFPNRVLELTQITIFDRWGEQVYNSQQNLFWNGQFNGVTQPSGTYYYSIKARQIRTNEILNQTGVVTLIK